VRVYTLFVLAFVASNLNGAAVTFNAPDVASVESTRASWIAYIGEEPDYLVDFENFRLAENVSGISGLFPGGLTITDTSPAGSALVQFGVGFIGSSNPVGTAALIHNEQAYLRFDFSNPVDYIGWRDIDAPGGDITIFFEGGATQNFQVETTLASGDVAEFVGIWRNDMPKITAVRINAYNGDGTWGVDNLEYGNSVPEPSSYALIGAGATLLGVLKRRKVNKQ
jgi:hypothetical protein